ncbi:serine-threonine protein kinase [Actinacidiphila acidipaludis]|uniref:serine-threonine protein kinase n=1 Tax=Actinacidiphila acidipaludis TaxID=2873382 RepID=UPI003556A157
MQPYWDLTFDAGGDPDPHQRDALLSGARGLTDLVVFSHGWNNDLSTANALYDRFYAPFPGLVAAAPKARFGYVGVHWPSMRFSDEPIPDFPHAAALAAPAAGGPALAAPAVGGTPSAAPAAGGSALDARTRADLAAVFPGSEDVVARIADLLAQQPEEPERLAEFAGLVRRLTGVAPQAAVASVLAEDMASAAAGIEPQLLAGDPAAMCDVLADALAQVGCPVAPAQGETILGGLGGRVWDGAKELLRQATYYAMKRRAGTVGEQGLGPLLGGLAAAAPGVRVHLVGHSFGARLVSFALRGLPPGVRVASVTLLQGAFSHYTFSGPLPFDAKGGALHGMQQRVTGPVVACHSSHDQALSVFYPLASRIAGEDESLLGFGDRWGAMGHDGFQSLDGTPVLTLAAALAGPFPGGGCVSVDASAVVCAGGPPSGAHSDICHEELARLVLRATKV